MAFVLDFPRAFSFENAIPDKQPAAGPLSAEPTLPAVRRNIRLSLLVLDIVVFQLRQSMSAPMSAHFAQELTTIDALLAAARHAARKI